MIKDFREYLVEGSRHDEIGRVYKEIAVGLKVFISFQASDAHASYPEETLDDPYAYSKWEVTLRQVSPSIDVPKVGAWNYLQHNYWAKPFDKPEFQKSMIGEFIPTKHCQQVLQDVFEYAKLKGQLESEDDIRIVEPDEEIKKVGGGCGGCGGGKKPKKK